LRHPKDGNVEALVRQSRAEAANGLRVCQYGRRAVPGAIVTQSAVLVALSTVAALLWQPRHDRLAGDPTGVAEGASAEPISTREPEMLALLDALLEEQDGPGVFFHRKLRIIVSNISGKDLVVGPGTRWLTDRNDIKLEPLKHPVWELEGDHGWHAGSWTGGAPGRAIRTWIGLHAAADENEVRRHTVTRSLGTLVVPIKIDGVGVEQSSG
jgi:hypothetical protein